MSERQTAVISVIIEAQDLDSVNLDAMAKRIRQVVNGESVPDVPNAPDVSDLKYSRCNGVDIFGLVCIGSSK